MEKTRLISILVVLLTLSICILCVIFYQPVVVPEKVVHTPVINNYYIEDKQIEANAYKDCVMLELSSKEGYVLVC